MLVRISITQHASTLRHQQHPPRLLRTTSALVFRSHAPGSRARRTKSGGEEGETGTGHVTSDRSITNGRRRRRRQRSWLTRRWRGAPCWRAPANTPLAHLHTAVPRSRDVGWFAYSWRPPARRRQSMGLSCCRCRLSLLFRGGDGCQSSVTRVCQHQLQLLIIITHLSHPASLRCHGYYLLISPVWCSPTLTCTFEDTWNIRVSYREHRRFADKLAACL